MPLTFPLPPALNGTALTEQLRSAGFPDVFVYVAGDDLVISGPRDKDQAKVAAVVAAHDGQPLPLPPAEQQARDAEAALIGLRSKALEVTGGKSTFSAAQRDKILAAIVLRSSAP